MNKFLYILDVIVYIALLLLLLYNITMLIRTITYTDYNVFQFLNVTWKLCLSYLILRIYYKQLSK